MHYHPRFTMKINGSTRLEKEANGIVWFWKRRWDVNKLQNMDPNDTIHWDTGCKNKVEQGVRCLQRAPTSKSRNHTLLKKSQTVNNAPTEVPSRNTAQWLHTDGDEIGHRAIGPAAMARDDAPDCLLCICKPVLVSITIRGMRKISNWPFANHPTLNTKCQHVGIDQMST